MKGLLTILLTFYTFSLYAQSIAVSGHIRDAESGEVLQDVNIYSVAQKRGTTADRAGYYRLYLSSGKVELLYSHVGYTTQRLTLNLTRDTIVDVLLKQDNLLKDVTVYAPRRDFGTKSSQISAIEVPITQIKSIPALFGEVDVMKALQLLPGVQSGGDGNAGIYVRGGNYDQNMITLDGATLYNADHLKGFVSSLNADMIHNIVLYKGGFPARYGSRLSSVVDVGVKEGDYERYHAGVTLGMLSSRIQAGGPLAKGKSSFNIAARLSYFDLIVQPLLKKIADSSGTLSSFANMNYYDINAKVTHKFSECDKLSAVFYLGNDVADTAPTDSNQEYIARGINESGGLTESRKYVNFKMNGTENSWGNLVTSLYWNRSINERWNGNINLSYSRYSYRLRMSSFVQNDIFKPKSATDGFPDVLERSYMEDSWAVYHSGISDMTLATDFSYTPNTSHHIRFGGKFSSQYFTPVVDVFKHTTTKQLLISGEYRTEENTIDETVGKNSRLNTIALYCEDDFSLGRSLKLNIGLRYTLFAAKEKSYHSLEPRFSGRLLLREKLAFKASFSMMGQGFHLLSSSNLVMPSDIWVPITENFEPMKSSQLAAGLSYELSDGIDLSVEGYYKSMDNMLEYMEGASYMSAAGSWEEMVAMGRGWSYGAELFVQKKKGQTTGWLSYTWAKSLRQFDRPGQLVSGGDKFYANNDCRHNLSITISHRMGKSLEVSATFVLNSGRRGILATDVMYGGILDEYDPYYIPATMFEGSTEKQTTPDGWSYAPDGSGYIRKYSRFYTYSERNSYKLPLYHRLAAGLSYFIFHEKGKSTLNLSIYNVYNRQNISNVYIGYHENKTVLKGVCLFPFMPSLSYTYQF